MPGFVEITFPQLSEGHAQHASVVSITPDIAGLLSDNGWSASDFNKITWPIGAGSYGIGRFLVSRKTLELLSELASYMEGGEDEDGLNVPLHIMFDGLLFDRMYMLPAVPVLAPSQQESLTAPQFFVVDFVDERYWWQKHFIEVERLGDDNEPIKGSFRHGLNMMAANLYGSSASIELDRTSMFRPENPNGPDEGFEGVMFPWTLRDVLDVMLGEYDSDGHNGRKEFFYLPPRIEWSYSNDIHDYNDFDIIDVHKTGRPFGEFLDTVCTLAGTVLIAYPNLEVALNADEEQGDKGIRYRVAPLADTRSTVFREKVNDHIISGGMLPAIEPTGVNVVVDPNMGLPEYAIRTQIPQNVVVHFARKYQGARQEELWDDQDTDPTLNNYTTIGKYTTGDGEEQVPAPPPGRPYLWANKRPANVYSSVYAFHRFDKANDEVDPPTPAQMVWVNEETCIEYAEIACRRYYDRFRSGPLDMLLMGTYGNVLYGDAMYLWPGCQTIEWSLTEHGPTTRLSGSYHHPLYGFGPSNELGRDNLQTTTMLKSYIRPDGSVVYQLPISSNLITLYHATVTKVEISSEGLPEYTAESVTDESITYTTSYPIRAHDITKVDIVPLEVGDYCIIGMGYFQEDEGQQSSQYSSPSSGSSMQSQLMKSIGQGRSLNRSGSGDVPVLEPRALYVFEQPKTVHCDALQAVAATGGFYSSLPTTTGRY